MIPALFGQGTLTHDLRGALEELSSTQRTIADRVANKISQSDLTSFGGELDSAMASQEESLTRDMTSLADTETRYEATAKLLQKSYADLRAAMTDRG